MVDFLCTGLIDISALSTIFQTRHGSLLVGTKNKIKFVLSYVQQDLFFALYVLKPFFRDKSVRCSQSLSKEKLDAPRQNVAYLHLRGIRCKQRRAESRSSNSGNKLAAVVITTGKASHYNTFRPIISKPISASSQLREVFRLPHIEDQLPAGNKGKLSAMVGKDVNVNGLFAVFFCSNRPMVMDKPHFFILIFIKILFCETNRDQKLWSSFKIELLMFLFKFKRTCSLKNHKIQVSALKTNICCLSISMMHQLQKNDN